MDIMLHGARCRILGLEFAADGPALEGTPLLIKTRKGFAPRSRGDLERLVRRSVDAVPNSGYLYGRLAAIATAMNAGDVALAAIATAQLQLRTPAPARDDGDMIKASPDDPLHPGWPAGTPGGRGGKFRPKDATIALDPNRVAQRTARLERLQARRGVRAALLRVLTPKRLVRLGLEGLGEAVPGFEALDTALLVEDLAEISAGIAGETVETDAAIAFVEQGPKTLEQLMVSEEEQTFSSFADFTKLDLERKYGPAGNGYEYHHIVEQSSGLSEAELNSTSNIVRIPKLLHEEVNAAYSRYDEQLGTSLRQSLSGASFAERRAVGVEVLLKLGIIQQ